MLINSCRVNYASTYCFSWKGPNSTMYSRGNTSGLSSISYGSNLSGGSHTRKPGQKNKRVQVWARVRPTAEFAYDNLELLPDGKVLYHVFGFYTASFIINIMSQIWKESKIFLLKLSFVLSGSDLRK